MFISVHHGRKRPSIRHVPTIDSVFACCCILSNCLDADEPLTGHDLEDEEVLTGILRGKCLPEKYVLAWFLLLV